MAHKVFCIVFLNLLLASAAWSQSMNGFDLSSTSIPVERILRGGPPKDGIPAIDNPKFDAADEAQWLAPDERVMGLYFDGIARAYPIAILNWHEIVNDEFNGHPVVVTFCPLCNTGMVFDGMVEDEPTSFGVSGLLFESDVLLYDRETDSLWTQIWARAISGPRQGQTLTILPVQHTSWQAWREAHPETEVLSRETGFRRDYLRNPYAGYEASPTTLFPVANRAPGPWHTKEWVLGVSFNDEHKAYPYEELDQHGLARFEDQVGGVDFTLVWDSEHRSAHIEHQGEALPSLVAFWFAWYAFYPGTEVFVAP